jgi:hypothetical protein
MASIFSSCIKSAAAAESVISSGSPTTVGDYALNHVPVTQVK